MEYYRSHWVDIDAPRLATYNQMLQWTPNHEFLFQGLHLDDCACAVDYGCGPGWISLELATRMANDSQVVACDLNQEFLKLGAKHAAEKGLVDQVEWQQVTDDRVPLSDKSADLVLCKNVLEYIESPDEMLAEFLRVLEPGGTLRMVDSDWDLLVIEPIDSERLSELRQYAQHAFRDPLIGRKLYGLAQRAGFTDIDVQIVPAVDTKGFLVKLVMENLIKYAIDGGYAPEKGKRFLASLHTSLQNNELLIALPQFMVTGIAA